MEMQLTKNQDVKLKKIAPGADMTGAIGITITIGSVIIGFVSVYLFFLIFFGILPGLVAKIIDRTQEQILGKIVVVFNALGMLYFMLQIIANIHYVNSTAASLVASPVTWLIIYSCCAFGWLIYLFTPRIFILIQTIRADVQINNLTQELNQIQQEWNVKTQEAARH